jgi:uncharacterized protein (TIGR04255 family)
MTYEDICYSSPFIKEAIIRIDFPAPVLALSENLKKPITKAALSRFPIFEPQKIQAQEFKFSGDAVSETSRKEISQSSFHGKAREKSIIISPTTIFQSTKDYQSYEIFTGDFFHVIDAVKSSEPDITVSRIGVRYVNVIDLHTGDPLDWSGYINSSMLSLVNLNKHKDKLSRAFNVLDYSFDSVHLKFQFGIVNPDYPAIVKRRQFVLDLDAFSAGSYDLEEVQKIVEEAHAIIQDYFEFSIEDKTRKLMKKKKIKDKGL